MDQTKAVIKAADEQGWRIREGKHYMCLAPDGVTIVVIAKTGSDRRGLDNAIAKMRRAGFIWPPRKGGK